MKTLTILMALVMVAISGSIFAAQQSATSSQGQQESTSSQQGVLAKADSLKGTGVVDPNGQNLGKVESVTLDLVSGKISYVTVDPGRGDKLVPVPYDMFGVMRDKRLILNVDKNKLDAAPSYAKSSQPNWANQQWGQQVADFWGKGPSGIATGQASPSPQASSQQPATMGSSGQPPTSSPQPMSGSQQPTANEGQQPMSQPAPADQGQQPTGSSGQPPAETSQPPTGTTGT